MIRKKKIAIVNYGLGNIFNIKRAFEYIESDVLITNNIDSLLNASAIVLPGVGAFPQAMSYIKNLNLEETLLSIAKKGTPLLGICLGMQLLLGESEELGITKGLNLIPGKVISINKIKNFEQKLKIPHIGWNTINEFESNKHSKSNLFKKALNGNFYYFVHSFVSIPDNSDHRIYDTNYEGLALPAIINKNNIFGFQFHPELSGKTGLNLLKKFISI